MVESSPPVAATPALGDRRTIVHTFTVDEVRTYAEISGDRGVQHLVPDPEGRLMVHGLLLGTLPTVVGGSLNFLAREMTFEFLRPVWTGEEVRCDVELTHWEESGDRVRVSAEWTCRTAGDVTVMRGRASGIVRRESPRS